MFQAGQLAAQQPKTIYLYDDLGRLIRVVNENNECATYAYDAVGNMLSITRSTNCLQPPTIASLSQDTARAGDTACLTITGTNFLGATVTTDNPEIQMSRVRISETGIEVCLAISFLSAIGDTKIIITTPGGVIERTFTITAVNPTISAINPASGPPTRLVTISGTAFHPIPAQNIVSFNGIPATVFRSTVFSIAAAVPADVTPGPTTVTVTVEGRMSNAFPFTVTTPSEPPPVIASVTPNRGSTEGGSRILISGSGFTSDTSVFLDNEASSVAFIDATTIRMIIPPGTAGPADVLVSHASGSAFLPGGFTYVSGPVLRVVAVNPPPGVANIPTNFPVWVLFSSPINPATVNTASFSLTPCGSAAQIPGSFSFNFTDSTGFCGWW